MQENICQDAHIGTDLTSKLSKQIMSEIREGDYNHPGGEEAIELVFSRFTKNPTDLLLDVGCGPGGTAEYLQKNGWGNVVGIDINDKIVEVAQQTYQRDREFPKFFHCNICDAVQTERTLNQALGSSVKFDTIYLFNSFFLFPNHTAALQTLKRIAKPGANLIVYAYVDYGKYMEDPYMENDIALLQNCVKHSQINKIFSDTGWQVTEQVDMDDKYIQWYSELMKKIATGREMYSRKYGAENYAVFERRYQHILDALIEKQLGARTIYAENVSSV